MHKTSKSEIGTWTPKTGVKRGLDLGLWALGFGDCLPKSGSWRVGLQEKSAVIGHFFLVIVCPNPGLGIKCRAGGSGLFN